MSVDVAAVGISEYVRGAMQAKQAGRTLADEEADADAAHVEAVEKLLDRKANPVRLFAVLPLEDAPAASVTGREGRQRGSPRQLPSSGGPETHATVMTVGSCRVLIFWRHLVNVSL
jgi:hypothetical protein